MKLPWSVLGGAAAGALTARLLGAHRQEMRAIRRYLVDRSRVVETRQGAIEVGITGEGSPVLVVHGIGGGYDQGLVAAQVARGDSFQVLAVSRFGYLRTPVPADTSPAAQADGYAALLDELNIPKVAIIGLSAGGPSSIEFALRHADRCSALVLVSAVARRFNPRITAGEKVLLALFSTNFSTWLLRDVSEDWFLALDGVSAARRKALRVDPVRQAIARSILYPLPVSARRAGSQVDMQMFPTLPAFPLDRIAVPTLAVHGTADQIVPFAHGQLVAATVPDAQFVPVPGGGHLSLVTHPDIALAPVLAFLRRHRAM